GPYLFLKEQNLKIVEVNEKNITIPCTGRSYPTPRVIWKKDGKEIQSRENIIDASINSTEASNNSTEVSNNSTEASNNSTEVSNNSTGASNNFIYQISTPSRLDNKSNVSIEVTSTLFVRTNGIKYEDHGNYTCEVLNVNESSIPLSKTVEIQFPPRITKGPSNMTINEGENVNLTCDAEGPPKPTFSWSNVSARVTIEEIIRNNDKLKLRNVRSAGKYKFIVTCKASNKGGNSTAN
ncbi:hemicentin-1-like isoform X3, partial [Paramuricea clavata]